MAERPNGSSRSCWHGHRRPRPIGRRARSSPMLDVRTAGSWAGRSLPAATGHRARRRRVLMITYDFPPPPSMAGETCAQIARYLPFHGWDPVVLSARQPRTGVCEVPPDGPLPRAVIRAGALPHPISIYQRLVARSRPSTGPGADGTSSPRTSGDLRRWILSMLQIPDAYSGWIPPAVIAGLRAIREHQVDQLFSASPHSTGHLVGLALARLSGLPWTAQFQDPWTYPRAQWQEAKPLSALSARLGSALGGTGGGGGGGGAGVSGRHGVGRAEAHPCLPRRKIVPDRARADRSRVESG